MAGNKMPKKPVKKVKMPMKGKMSPKGKMVKDTDRDNK